MSSDPESQLLRSVTEGEVTVTKSYAPEEFPVPAIKFVVESTADERLDVRVVDTIPEEFPMENVGFHPDFEKDNWTAYRTHKVEYDRTLDPGESVTTVYGIRLEETEPAAFMIDPELELLGGDGLGSTDQALDAVLGDDSNQVVRDVLSGQRESLPGLDDEGDVTIDSPSVDAEHEDGVDEDAGVDADAGDADLDLDLDEATSDAPRPAAFDDSGVPVTDQPADAVVTAFDGGAAADVDLDDGAPADEEGERVDTDDGVVEDIALEVEADESSVATDAAPEATENDGEDHDDVPVKEAETGRNAHVTAGSVLAALTNELTRDDVDDAALEAIREALGVDEHTDTESVPRSVDLRIQRLQNQVEDLAAYSAGLEAFLDEEGTAEELIEDFRAEVEATTGTIDALVDRVDAADEDRAGLRDGLSGVESDVSELSGRFEAVDDRLDSLDDRLAGVDSRLDAVDDQLGDVDETVDALDDRLDSLDDRLAGVDTWLGEVDERASHADDRVGSLHEEMGEVREELATLDGDIREAREHLAGDVDDLRAELDEQVTATLDEHTDEVEAVRDDVASLQSDVDSLDDTVEDFRAFRTRLSSALGPLAGGSEPNGADGDGAGDEADSSDEGDDGDDGDGDTEADNGDDDTEADNGDGDTEADE